MTLPFLCKTNGYAARVSSIPAFIARLLCSKVLYKLCTPKLYVQSSKAYQSKSSKAYQSKIYKAYQSKIYKAYQSLIYILGFREGVRSNTCCLADQSFIFGQRTKCSEIYFTYFAKRYILRTLLNDIFYVLCTSNTCYALLLCT